MASKTRYHRFQFMSRPKPDLVMGERVILEIALPPMRRSSTQEPLDHTTVHGFVRHVEQQMMLILERYGSDCGDFELKLDHGYPVGIYFSRPMDQLELLEIREWRKRLHQHREEKESAHAAPVAAPAEAETHSVP